MDLYYGAAQALKDVSVTAEPGQVTCILGRNGVGKTSLMRAISGPAGHRRRADHLGRPGNQQAQVRRPGPARGGDGAPGAGDFSAADGAGEPGDRLRAAAEGRAEGTGHGLRPVPGAGRNDGPPRRRPLGRAAAAAGDRAGDGDAAEAPAHGRADRGHPAVDHQGYRPGDRLPARPGAHRHRAGGAVSSTSPSNWPAASR